MFEKYSKKKSDNRQSLRSDLLLPPSANLTTSGWLEPGSARALKMLRNHCHYHVYHGDHHRYYQIHHKQGVTCDQRGVTDAKM